jgi:hypothetical protein
MFRWSRSQREATEVPASGAPADQRFPADELVEAAKTLHDQHRLPDVSVLLRDLNETRKSEAYGDVQTPELDAEDVASEIELFIESVGQILEK